MKMYSETSKKSNHSRSIRQNVITIKIDLLWLHELIPLLLDLVLGSVKVQPLILQHLKTSLLKSNPIILKLTLLSLIMFFICPSGKLKISNENDKSGHNLPLERKYQSLVGGRCVFFLKRTKSKMLMVYS